MPVLLDPGCCCGDICTEFYCSNPIPSSEIRAPAIIVHVMEEGDCNTDNNYLVIVPAYSPPDDKELAEMARMAEEISMHVVSAEDILRELRRAAAEKSCRRVAEDTVEKGRERWEKCKEDCMKECLDECKEGENCDVYCPDVCEEECADEYPVVYSVAVYVAGDRGCALSLLPPEALS